MAALVEQREAERVVLRLVNLSVDQAGELIVQAGAFGEHRFREATFARRVSAYPGAVGSYAAPALETVEATVRIDDAVVEVYMPPATGCGSNFRSSGTPIAHRTRCRGYARSSGAIILGRFRKEQRRCHNQ